MFLFARFARIARIARIGHGVIVLGLLGGALAAASACSATSAPAAGGAGGPDSGPGVPAVDGGGGPAVDGGGGDDGGGGEGGSAGTGAPLGLVLVSQATTPSTVHVSVVAQFLAAAPALPAGCTITQVAGCVATSCPVVAPTPPQSTLNAGAITVTGTGVSSPATLTFGPGPTPGVNSYSPVTAQTKFYSSGDALSVSGAGGADLPSFATQTVIAPNDIVLTEPACASASAGGACTDVDRSTDATLTWTGGGAGKVTVYYITDSDDGSKTLSCIFDASSGTGVVPSAALMMLYPASAPGYYGQESIIPFDAKAFMVGTLAAELKVQGTAITGTFMTVN